MTQNDTNFNSNVFTDPHSFLPERWLDPNDRKRLSRYLLAFGRGARSCLGMEVAYMQIYLALGRLFAPNVQFDLELHDTDYEQDVVLFHDYFAPFPKSKKGIRVFVK